MPFQSDVQYTLCVVTCLPSLRFSWWIIDLGESEESETFQDREKQQGCTLLDYYINQLNCFALYPVSSVCGNCK